MIVFGGTDGTRRNEVSSLSLEDLSWSAIEASGACPSRRNEASAVFDARRERLVVFGGYEEDQRPLGDAWWLSMRVPHAWRRLNASIGLPPNHDGYHAAAYDSRRGRLVLYGGVYWVPGNVVYTLDLGAEPRWARLEIAGPNPGRRLLPAAVYDPVRDRVIVIGGYGRTV
jgi:hypothetical protein